ncbi:hypothetical protein B0H16DRAFT_1023773 [Mycena metata]|uniref:Uncharacterized protein n=1 Tax=Mycena metata TaxID=1033252 RepID=A0AAD7IHD1_9AGAR|nr:hypothetical protein B0H16DRAFT_1023773 [Mycena metata]
MCTSILLQLHSRCACAPFTRAVLCASGRATGYEGAAGRAYTDLDEVSFLARLLLPSPFAQVAIYSLLYTYTHHPLFLALSSLYPHARPRPFLLKFSHCIRRARPLPYESPRSCLLTFLHPPTLRSALLFPSILLPSPLHSLLPNVHDPNTFSSQTLARPLAVLPSGGPTLYHQRHFFLRTPTLFPSIADYVSMASAPQPRPFSSAWLTFPSVQPAFSPSSLSFLHHPPSFPS